MDLWLQKKWTSTRNYNDRWWLAFNRHCLCHFFLLLIRTIFLLSTKPFYVFDLFYYPFPFHAHAIWLPSRDKSWHNDFFFLLQFSRYIQKRPILNFVRLIFTDKFNFSSIPTQFTWNHIFTWLYHSLLCFTTYFTISQMQQNWLKIKYKLTNQIIFFFASNLLKSFANNNMSKCLEFWHKLIPVNRMKSSFIRKIFQFSDN